MYNSKTRLESYTLNHTLVIYNYRKSLYIIKKIIIHHLTSLKLFKNKYL